MGDAVPQDVSAEDHVLGACLLSVKAIDAVAELLAPADFYRGSSGRIFQAILDMYGAGEPVDVVTLAARLERGGVLDDVGGVARVNELAALVPAVGNVSHYAKIVRGAATLRGLARVGAEITRLVAEPDGASPAELVDRGGELLFDLAAARQRSDLVRPADLLVETLRELGEIQERGGGLIGLSTGLSDLDRLTAGLQPGNLIVLGARPSIGKALSLDAGVLTPTGWRRMGDIAVGDEVIGADGEVDTVTGVYDQGEQPLWRLMLSDGCSVECSDDHLWLTRTRSDRRRGVPGAPKPTREIRETLKRQDSPTAANHSIPYVEPIHFRVTQEPLPLDPYWLGLFLGDGCASNWTWCNPEPDLQREFAIRLPGGDEAVLRKDGGRGYTFGIRKRQRNSPGATRAALSELELDNSRSYEKFVPQRYLLASASDRLALLQGLCDTDGYVTSPHPSSTVEFSTSSARLRDGVLFLVGSLGGRATCIARATHYRARGVRHEARTSYRIVLSFPRGGVVPVRSEKHLARWSTKPQVRGRERMIADVEAVGVKPCRCITVGRSFYVTDGFMVTHNSSAALGIAANAAVRLKLPVVLFTLEMSRREVMHRLLALEAHVDLHKLRTGKLSLQEWGRVHDAGDKVQAAPLFIDDAGAPSVLEIRSKSRQLRHRHPELALVVVDYLQLVAQDAENRTQEVSKISRALKVLAGELDVPVLALAQLNRQVEQRHDKRPMLSDLRESGEIEAAADVVILAYREEVYFPDDPECAGLAELNVAKQRNGPTGVVKLAFEKRYAGFLSLSRDTP